jgi:hypothetical protein
MAFIRRRLGLSALTLFFMQSESCLSCQRSLEEGSKTSNCQTLFGMTKTPTDNRIRSMLGLVHPSHLQEAFNQAVAEFSEHGGMKEFQRFDGRTLIAPDGAEYFCSQEFGCRHCQTRMRANGEIEFHHSMLAASLVPPGHAMVLPLMPEFIVNPDGAEKQDCVRNAAKRWLAAYGSGWRRYGLSISAAISHDDAHRFQTRSQNRKQMGLRNSRRGEFRIAEGEI